VNVLSTLNLDFSILLLMLLQQHWTNYNIKVIHSEIEHRN